jgi:hypothetical protein
LTAHTLAESGPFRGHYLFDWKLLLFQLEHTVRSHESKTWCAVHTSNLTWRWQHLAGQTDHLLQCINCTALSYQLRLTNDWLGSTPEIDLQSFIRKNMHSKRSSAPHWESPHILIGSLLLGNHLSRACVPAYACRINIRRVLLAAHDPHMGGTGTHVRYGSPAIGAAPED